MSDKRWTLIHYLGVLVPAGIGLGAFVGWLLDEMTACLAIGAGVGILLALAAARWEWESGDR